MNGAEPMTYALADTHCPRCCAALTCSICGASLQTPHGGLTCPSSVPKACGGHHKQKAYRRRLAARQAGAPHPECRARFASVLTELDLRGQRLLVPQELDLRCHLVDSHTGAHEDPAAGIWRPTRWGQVELAGHRGLVGGPGSAMRLRPRPADDAHAPAEAS